jgi:hypothetical protein
VEAAQVSRRGYIDWPALRAQIAAATDAILEKEGVAANVRVVVEEPKRPGAAHTLSIEVVDTAEHAAPISTKGSN